jgi:hypothetical protein
LLWRRLGRGAAQLRRPATGLAVNELLAMVCIVPFVAKCGEAGIGTQPKLLEIDERNPQVLWECTKLANRA